MPDLLVRLERVRRAERISQARIAREIGVSQGHLSKVLRGKATLSQKLGGCLAKWMSNWEERSGAMLPTQRRVAFLVESIHSQCIELMHLLRAGKANDVERSSGAETPGGDAD